jgi:hypothetical protein
MEGFGCSFPYFSADSRDSVTLSSLRCSTGSSTMTTITWSWWTSARRHVVPRVASLGKVYAPIEGEPIIV